MLQRILITLCIILYAVGVPFLEINETHVFNPDWTPHAKIHEVWQLITNSLIGFLCLWLCWLKNQVKLSIVLSLIVMSAFMIAFSLQDYYGGSMKYLDGSEKVIAGINIGVLGFGIGIFILVIAFIMEHKQHIEIQSQTSNA